MKSKSSIIIFIILILSVLMLLTSCIRFIPSDGANNEPEEQGGRNTPVIPETDETEKPENKEPPLVSPALKTHEALEPGIYELTPAEPVIADINGKASEIEIINSDGSLFLLYSGSGPEQRVLIADIYAGYLLDAYFVLSSDSCPYLVVSYDYCSDDYETKVFSFSGSEPLEILSLPLYVSWIEDFGFEANGYIDAVGTWDVITTVYFVHDTIEWRGTYVLDTESESYTEVIVARDLPVYLNNDGTYEESTLLPGAPVYFTSTDGETYMEFVLWDDTEGYFNFERNGDWEPMIGGAPAFDYFDELPMFG
ncbi:MAG: hypothetical protein BWY11_00610 [Firmicutes bacterium ADurb.Bin182]|nr:MAG: hypothetical protein BWY11_00610 [Firmicutes bacterium ADurb.Bin182]